jgi:hypothetical protein
VWILAFDMTDLISVTHDISRVGQNHVCMRCIGLGIGIGIRHFWQGIHRVFSHHSAYIRSGQPKAYKEFLVKM